MIFNCNILFKTVEMNLVVSLSVYVCFLVLYYMLQCYAKCELFLSVSLNLALSVVVLLYTFDSLFTHHVQFVFTTICFVWGLCFMHVNIIYLHMPCLCQIVRVAMNCLPFESIWVHPCFRWDLRCSTCVVFCGALLVYLLLCIV